MSSRAAETQRCRLLNTFKRHLWHLCSRKNQPLIRTYILLPFCQIQTLHLLVRWPRPQWCHPGVWTGCLCCWLQTSRTGRERGRWPHPLSHLYSPHLRSPECRREEIWFCQTFIYLYLNSSILVSSVWTLTTVAWGFRQLGRASGGMASISRALMSSACHRERDRQNEKMDVDMLFMSCYTHFGWGLKSQVFSPLIDSFVKVTYNI